MITVLFKFLRCLPELLNECITKVCWETEMGSNILQKIPGTTGWHGKIQIGTEYLGSKELSVNLFYEMSAGR